MKKLLPVIVVLLVCFLLAIIVVPLINMGASARENAIRANMDMIQAALERYSVDNGGKYPADIRELVQQSYLTAFPVNPYKQASSAGDSQSAVRSMNQMRNMSNEDPANPGELAGNFIYMPLYEDGAHGIPEVTGYTLVGFARGADEDEARVVYFKKTGSL